ncbi:MAG: glycosyltransferase family 4 protein [candidate division WOR-3 bacterium]|nr:glycosyltransferase family 4 protein [candidate division WOR-3 bacterium]
MIKVIQMLHCSPSWVSANLDENIFDGWQTRTAKALQRLNISQLQIESWIIEKRYRKSVVFEKDGLIYRIFPSLPLTYGREISFEMIKALKTESRSPIILHIHGLFNWTTYLLAGLFPRLPIVVQHHGDCPPIYLLPRRQRLFLILPFLLLEEMVMRNLIRRIDYIFCLTKATQRILELLGIRNRCLVQGMGVDFNIFTPDSKFSARKKLNLSLDKKIILYIGKAYTYKGCDQVILAYQKLKEKYSIELVMVGVSKSDELYQSAINAGAKVFPRVDPYDLIDFYRSADAFVLPGSKIFNRWGGIGVSTIESLACNVPVVSGTLIHFPERIAGIGIFAESLEQTIKGLEYILTNPQQFYRCREYAQQYYDWNVIMGTTLEVYKNLLYKYYKIKLDFDAQ